MIVSLKQNADADAVRRKLAERGLWVSGVGQGSAGEPLYYAIAPFSAAADVLHTVQSNVSTHIARLERELGVTLVDRAAGRLTEEGEVVVARARRIAGELDAPVDAADARKRSGSLPRSPCVMLPVQINSATCSSERSWERAMASRPL